MKFFILICALTLVSGQQWGSPVSQCRFYNGPLPTTVDIGGCTISSCTLNIGETTNFDILFRAPHDINTLRTRATVFLSIIPVIFDLGPAGDTCSNLLSGRCPANQGALFLHRLSVFIDDFIPPNVTLPIEISILDENNELVACFRVSTYFIRQGQKLGAINVPELE